MFWGANYFLNMFLHLIQSLDLPVSTTPRGYTNACHPLQWGLKTLSRQHLLSLHREKYPDPAPNSMVESQAHPPSHRYLRHR